MHDLRQERQEKIAKQIGRAKYRNDREHDARQKQLLKDAHGWATRPRRFALVDICTSLTSKRSRSS